MSRSVGTTKGSLNRNLTSIQVLDERIKRLIPYTGTNMKSKLPSAVHIIIDKIVKNVKRIICMPVRHYDAR